MLHIVLQFPAGRLHATPWGRHVNEGDVEWPPSPWRIYRALLAVGFNRLGWTELPTAARTLFDTLALRLPAYHLPAATAAHTRHYMPQFKGSTSKVLDAFAFVGRGPEDVIGISWDVNLPPDVLAVFDELIHHVTYLGRAESWVDAQRVEAIPEGLDQCYASESAPGPGYDRFPLLAPLAPEAFAAWRTAAVEQERRKRFGADESGIDKKTKKTKGTAKKDSDAIEALFPVDIVAGLSADTAALQKQGWNQPPGTFWAAYWRRSGALATLPADRKPVTRARESMNTALLALSSNTVSAEVLPRLTESLRWLDGLHAALVALSTSEKNRRDASPCFSGRDENNALLAGHQHATLLPLNLDTRHGRLDHVLVHAPMGFDDAAIRALRRIRRLYTDKKATELFVSLVGVGTIIDMQTAIPQLQSSQVWRSVTPFIPPRFLKARGSNNLEGQIRAELDGRGIANPTTIEIELEEGFAPVADAWSLWRPGAPAVVLTEDATNELSMRESRVLSRAWRHFRRQRFDRSKAPPVDAAFGLRLSFAVPVSGPIAIGYASHFGLGQFVPA